MKTPSALNILIETIDELDWFDFSRFLSKLEPLPHFKKWMISYAEHERSRQLDNVSIAANATELQETKSLEVPRQLDQESKDSDVKNPLGNTKPPCSCPSAAIPSVSSTAPIGPQENKISEPAKPLPAKTSLVHQDILDARQKYLDAQLARLTPELPKIFEDLTLKNESDLPYFNTDISSQLRLQFQKDISNWFQNHGLAQERFNITPSCGLYLFKIYLK